MIKLMITDDHQMVIDGLKALLKPVPDLEVVGEALHGAALLGQLKRLKPDVVLLDIGMPVMDGIEAAGHIKQDFPAVKILICTTHSEAYKVKKCLKVGVDGYILKGAGREELLKAIKQVVAGKSYYDAQIVEIIMDGFNTQRKQQRPELTEREIEVVQWIAQGKTTREIADDLFLSPFTIETHRRNILAKLELNNVVELVRYAIEHGIVEL